MVTTLHNTPAYLRNKECAQHFRITPMTLWRWRKHPDFPQPLRRGNVLLFDMAKVAEWLAAGAEQAAGGANG